MILFSIEDIKEYSITKIDGNLIEFSCNGLDFHYYVTPYTHEKYIDDQILVFLEEYVKHFNIKKKEDQEKKEGINNTKTDVPKEWLGTTRKFDEIKESDRVAERTTALLLEEERMMHFRRMYRRFLKEEKNKKVEASWTDQAIGVLKALPSIAMNDVVDEEIAKERLDTCYGCKYCVGEINPKCMQCGCFIDMKTLYTREKCPEGKW